MLVDHSSCHAVPAAAENQLTTGDGDTTPRPHNASSATTPPPKPQILPQDQNTPRSTPHTTPRATPCPHPGPITLPPHPAPGSMNPYFPRMPTPRDEITEAPANPASQSAQATQNPRKVTENLEVSRAERPTTKSTLRGDIRGWLDRRVKPRAKKPAVSDPEIPLTEAEQEAQAESELNPPVKQGLREEIRQWLNSSVTTGQPPPIVAVESKDEEEPSGRRYCCFYYGR